MKRKEKKIKQAPEKVKSLAELISAFVVIGGALIAAGQWIVHEINLSTNTRMDAIEKKIDDNQLNNELSTMRLELMTLISHDSDNIIEIEKLAKKYFNPPYNGDTYMTSVVSRWCDQKGINCGEIMLK